MKDDVYLIEERSQVDFSEIAMNEVESARCSRSFKITAFYIGIIVIP